MIQFVDRAALAAATDRNLHACSADLIVMAHPQPHSTPSSRALPDSTDHDMAFSQNQLLNSADDWHFKFVKKKKKLKLGSLT
jgi:hypothetical protein